MNVSYAAGIFDGEGSVYLCKRRLKQVIIYKPYINIVNTHYRMMMKELYNFIGVGIFNNFPSYSPLPRKPLYSINIYRPKDIIAFCDPILNYLIIKKEKCKIVRDYASYIEANRIRHHGGPGSQAKWLEDWPYVKQTFIIPFRKLKEV